MDPISSLLIAGTASLVASLAKPIVSRLWSRYILPRLKTDITITTNSGERVAIGPATELTPAKIQEIVARVERQSKDTSSAASSGT
jgi:hypothetical protein